MLVAPRVDVDHPEPALVRTSTISGWPLVPAGQALTPSKWGEVRDLLEVRLLRRPAGAEVAGEDRRLHAGVEAGTARPSRPAVGLDRDVAVREAHDLVTAVSLPARRAGRPRLLSTIASNAARSTLNVSASGTNPSAKSNRLTFEPSPMPNSAPNFGTCGSRRIGSSRTTSRSNSKLRGDERLADVEARVGGLLEQHDAPAGAGEQHRRRRAGGAAADDDDVRVHGWGSASGSGVGRQLGDPLDLDGQLGAAEVGPQVLDVVGVGERAPHELRDRGPVRIAATWYTRGRGNDPSPASRVAAPRRAAERTRAARFSKVSSVWAWQVADVDGLSPRMLAVPPTSTSGARAGLAEDRRAGEARRARAEAARVALGRDLPRVLDGRRPGWRRRAQWMTRSSPPWPTPSRSPAGGRTRRARRASRCTRRSARR
jgi:hypothetical protein